MTSDNSATSGRRETWYVFLKVHPKTGREEIACFATTQGMRPLATSDPDTLPRFQRIAQEIATNEGVTLRRVEMTPEFAEEIVP